MNLNRFLSQPKEKLITISAIFTVSIIAFGKFNSSILSSDDWSYFVARFAFGTLQPINLSDRRPLILGLYYGLVSLFGFRLEIFYFFNFLILFFSALMVYAIVKRIFPEHKWIASLVALVYLIYPVDYTRTWLIMVYIRFWWLVSLFAIWLQLEFAKTGNLWIFALGMSCIAIPLGAYEGQFGVILLTSILIALFSNRVPAVRRVLIPAGVFGIGFAFLIWRTSLQTRLFEIKDVYVEALQYSPVILAERYLYGLYIFAIGWFYPIKSQLELMRFNIGPWIFLYIAICCAIIFWVIARIFPDKRLHAYQKISSAKSYLTIFLIGCAIWVAGYFPIIALYRPALAIISSRVNTFAVPGAALMLVSGIAIIATFIANSNPIKQSIVIATIVPFIVAGIFVQLQVQRENQIAWETQKDIWSGVFTTIPNVQDKKSIVIIIPGYQNLRPFESYPFLSGWEVEAGVQVLYNNPSIGANYYYKDIQAAELLFTKKGFRPIPTDKIIPYKQLIFVYYNPKSGSVALVESLDDAISLPFTVKNYTPLNNIVSAKPSTSEYRWLVK